MRGCSCRCNLKEEDQKQARRARDRAFSMCFKARLALPAASTSTLKVVFMTASNVILGNTFKTISDNHLMPFSCPKPVSLCHLCTFPLCESSIQCNMSPAITPLAPKRTKQAARPQRRKLNILDSKQGLCSYNTIHLTH